MNISGDEVATCSLQDNFAAVMRASNASLLADRMEKVLLFLKTHNSEIENLPIYLVEEIRSIISTENLLKLWLQLLHLQVSSFATAKYYSNLMFNGHRSWAHLDCDRLLCPDLCRQSYLTSIAASFCQTLTADTSEEAHMQWGKIASLLSTEAKRYIYKQVHQNRQLIEISTRYLDSEMSLDFLTAFLSSGRTRSPSGACASPPDDGILRALVSACLTHWGIDVVFNRIVMHASSDETASAIVKCFSDHRAELLLFARLTAQLWGTAHVIRRGNKSMHCFLSTILLLIIPTLTQAELMEAPPEAALRGVHKKRDSSARQSTLSYLSLGVSACLDVADAGLRSRAMTVAKAFSKIMGVELDYSEDVPVENKKPPEKDKSRPAMEKSTTAYITDNNASDESDLESYLIDTEDDEPNDTANLIEGATGVSKEPSKFKTNYLRVCLEYLQLTEAAEDRRAKHLAALVCIPQIVQTRPEDARDMCGPVLKELLRMSNSFNIEQFETLRVNAALCLYTTYPLFSIPVLSWAVTHTSLAISSRLEVVAILVRGAYLLSGVSEPGTERDLTKDTAKVNEVNDSNPSRALGTTRVKRPKKLEIMKRKVIYTRNHFGSVAEAVFTPVSSIVAALLAADTRAAVTSNSDIALTDVLRYQKGGITEIPAFSIEPPQTSKRLHDIEDGIDLLLPSQCMLALACFVRCSINSICQRKITVATLDLASAIRDVPALQLRRASAVGLHSAIESWFHLRKNAENAAQLRKQSLMNGESNLLTPMNYITNLGNILADVSVASGGLDSDPAHVRIMEVLQWATQVVHTEADVGCKSLYLDMLRIAVDGMSS